MSFYDDASIVLIPSGYKTSKLYSQKPTDGSGDLTFTRTGSTATRVNSAGLIEECRTNLLLNSATLSTQNVTVVAAPYTLSIFGTGSVTLSGTGSGTLTGTGVSNRVTLTFTPTAGTLTLTVSGSVTSAQIETGDIATDYIPTTTAAVTVGPIANMPRLDYTGGGCPKLLMEPTRTNLLNYSEQFDNAYWSKTNTTITANNATSPDGYISADKLIDNSTSATHSVGRTITPVISTTYVFSCFVKKAELDYVILSCGGSGLTGTGGSGADRIASVNLNNGNIVTNNYNISAISFGNGWYRISIIFTTDADGGTITPYIATTQDGISRIYVGSGQGVFIYGAQLEAAAYATSYIPTLNASVTRNADNCSKTGISSLIGQTEGTLFVEINKSFAEAGERYIAISDGTANNRIMATGGVGGNIRGFITTAGSGVFDFTSAQSAVGTHRIGIAYANNDLVMYIDGIQVTSSSSVTIPSVGNLYIGTSESGGVSTLNGGGAQAILFKTRLSNADLATLTTL